MDRFLSTLTVLFVVLAVLPSSLSLVIRTSKFTLYSAPSTNSTLIKTICGLAELDVLCQIKGWSKVTGLDPLARARKPLWAILDGGKQIEGVPVCNGTEPSPQPLISTPLPACEHNPPSPTPGLVKLAPCQVPATRQGIVAAALWAANSRKSISYSQGGDRWSGIAQKICPYQGVPAAADSSSFVTWLYWSAFGNRRDLLNNQNWKDGYTGTMGKNGVSVSLAQARPGDVVLYGRRAPYDHAAVYVGNNKVVSFGAKGPAKLLPIKYRSNYYIRSYLP